MMENIVIGAGISIFVSVFIYLFKKRFDSVDENIKKIDEDLTDFKMHVVENFVSKTDHERDLTRIIEYVREGFKSLHKRFDRFEEQIRKELDGKEDKK